MSELPVEIVAGSTGHIAHHQEIHGLLNDLDGHSHSAGDVSGALDLDNAPAGSVFQIEWNGTAWRYNGATVTSRPSSRSDLRMYAIGGTARPTFMGTYDVWFEDVS